MISKINKLFLWNVIGLILLGTMLEAVLVSEVDGYCVDSPAGSDETGTRPILYPCHGGDNQAFSLVEGNGTICRYSDVCLISNENSEANQAEVIQAPESTGYGGIWKFEGGLVVNAFNLCLQRTEPTEEWFSQLIQANCNPDNNWQKFRFE